jgi:hypothetical protein
METVPAFLICGSTEQISVKFDTVSFYKNLSGQFNFGLHWLLWCVIKYGCHQGWGLSSEHFLSNIKKRKWNGLTLCAVISIMWYDFQYIFVSAVNDQGTEICKIEMIAFGKYVYFIRIYLYALFIHKFLLLNVKHMLSFYIINGLHVSVCTLRTAK